MRTIIKTSDPKVGVHYWNYDPDDQNLPDPNYLRAWPIGGGFAKSIPRSHVVDWDAQLPQQYNCVRLFIDGEEYLPGLRAWVNPLDNWNGWAKPLVDEGNLRKFIDEQHRLAVASPEAGFTTAALREEDKVLVVEHGGSEPGDNDRFEEIAPQTITVPGPDGKPTQLQVWDISLGMIWDAEDGSDSDLNALGGYYALLYVEGQRNTIVACIDREVFKEVKAVCVEYGSTAKVATFEEPITCPIMDASQWLDLQKELA